MLGPTPASMQLRVTLLAAAVVFAGVAVAVAIGWGLLFSGAVENPFLAWGIGAAIGLVDVVLVLRLLLRATRRRLVTLIAGRAGPLAQAPRVRWR